MNKYVLVISLFLSAVPKCFSQTILDEFSFVIIPQQFEFLNEKDKYELNSISVFLFNKHGFHAFKGDEVPNAKRCDGLYMDLVNVPVMLKTKFVIVLKDCNGFEIYSSNEGVSKIKEFKRSYQDALRKAFVSIENMGVKQKEVVLFKEESAVDIHVNQQTVAAELVAVGSVMTEPDIPIGSKSTSESKLPQAKFSSYTYNGNSYMLRKTSEGYMLYEEKTTEKDGLLLIGKIEAGDANKIYFTDDSDNIFQVTVDVSENLIIQRGDLSQVYKRVH